MKVSLNEQRLTPLFLEKAKTQRLTKKGQYTLAYQTVLNNLTKEIQSQIGGALEHYPGLWPNIAREDAESLVQEGLLFAIDTFSLSRRKNCKFISYLWTVIQRTMNNHLKYQSAAKRSYNKTVSFKALASILDISNNIAEDQGTRDALLDNYITVMDEDPHHRMLLEKIRSEVSPQDQLLLDRMLQGKTLKSIGKELGVSGWMLRLRLDRIARRFSHLKEQL